MPDVKQPTPTPNADAQTKEPARDRTVHDLELPEDKSKTVTGGACANGQHIPEVP